MYKFAAEVVPELSRRGICWAIENPANSLVWFTTPFARCCAAMTAGLGEIESVKFAHCMHGGGRDKQTSVWYGGGWSLKSLSAGCDKSHAHRPWGLSREHGTIFATAEERNYPRLLCQRISEIAAEYFHLPPPAPRAGPSKSLRSKIEKIRFSGGGGEAKFEIERINCEQLPGFDFDAFVHYLLDSNAMRRNFPTRSIGKV